MRELLIGILIIIAFGLTVYGLWNDAVYSWVVTLLWIVLVLEGPRRGN